MLVLKALIRALLKRTLKMKITFEAKDSLRRCLGQRCKPTIIDTPHTRVPPKNT